ncbi:MAG: hypothetical protein KDA68_10905 [Planctomycetaceae bacterium]|nr:hypothetical protein [Planctomycetaceae bacterium]
MISVTQCVGARWTSIDRSASVDDYANAINACIMNSEDEIPEIECNQMNEQFHKSIGSSEPDLRKNWDQILIQWNLKTNFVDVFRMHRFAAGNGAACSDDDKPFQVQYSRDWIPVAEEVRRLISIGPPDLLYS